MDNFQQKISEYTDLQNCNITSDQVTEICYNITTNSLRWLNLRDNTIGTDSAIQISNALHENESLTWLNLSNNVIGKEGIDKIADMLKVNKTLLELYLAYNNNFADGTVQICKALQINTTLQVLDFSSAEICVPGAFNFADMICNNKYLRVIHLDNNFISNAGAVKIAESLKTNSTLIEIYLRCNKISDDGAIAIANMLKINKILKVLDLSYNKIGKLGGNKISKALKNNISLKELHLNGNMFDNNDILNIVTNVDHSLTTLCLKNTDHNTIYSYYISKLLTKPKRTEYHPDIFKTEYQTLNLLNRKPDKYTLQMHSVLQSKMVFNCLKIDWCDSLYFYQTIQNSDNLIKLVVSFQYISYCENPSEILKILQVNQHITHLSLKELYVHDNVNVDFVTQLFTILQSNNSLRSLKIDGLNLLNCNLHAMANLLKENYTLTQLKLNRSNENIENILRRNTDMYKNIRFKTTKSARTDM